MNKEDLAAKVDWEGGAGEAIFGYGIGPGELPEETPDEVRQAWTRLYENAREDLETVERWLYP